MNGDCGFINSHIIDTTSWLSDKSDGGAFYFHDSDMLCG